MTAHRNPWLVLVLVCMAQFMVILDATIVNVALPSIQADLGISEADLQWIVNAYALTFGGFLLLGGRAGDLIGRKLVFLVGVGVLFFLLVHIIDIMLIGFGRDIYDESVAFYGRWEIIPMEVALVGAVIYHGLNGIRIILIDFTTVGYRRERLMFWIVLALSILLTIPSLFLIVAAHS